MVVGLPRGGVPVADEVARVLSAPLDVVVIRKLGVPWHEELAIGGWEPGLHHAADEYVCLSAPECFKAVGHFYVDFAATSDVEGVACLSRSRTHHPSVDPPPVIHRGLRSG